MGEDTGSHILKYYAFRATTAVGFTTPIWYIYVLNNGVSYAQMGVMDAAWWFALFLFEIPTGIIGDRVGRRNGLIIGSIVTIIAFIAMGSTSGFIPFTLLYVFWAFGITFRSGTADAWLYDILQSSQRGHEFANIRGRGNAVGLVVTGVTAILGGYIASFAGMEYTWYASAAVTAISVPILLTFPQSTPHLNDADGEDDDESVEENTFTTVDALPLIRNNFTRKPLRSFVVYVGLILGVYWGVNFFIQPVSTRLGLSVDYLGWMFAGFTALGAVANYYTDSIRSFLGIDGWFYAIPFVLGTLFVFTAFFPILAIPTFFVMRAEFNVTKALSRQFINDRIDSVGRATVLSAAGMAYTFFIIPFELGAGGLADYIGPVKTIGLFGTALIAGTLITWIIENPFEDVSGE